MVLTRADVEAELVDRHGAALTLVGKDGSTVDGSNADLNGAIREGLLSLGIFPAAFVVVDSDLAAVSAEDSPQLFDVASLRVLRNVLSSYTEVDSDVDRDRQKLNQVREGLIVQIATLGAEIRSRYGVGLGVASVGLFARDFAEADECSASEF